MCGGHSLWALPVARYLREQRADFRAFPPYKVAAGSVPKGQKSKVRYTGEVFPYFSEEFNLKLGERGGDGLASGSSSSPQFTHEAATKALAVARKETWDAHVLISSLRGDLDAAENRAIQYMDSVGALESLVSIAGQRVSDLMGMHSECLTIIKDSVGKPDSETVLRLFEDSVAAEHEHDEREAVHNETHSSIRQSFG